MTKRYNRRKAEVGPLYTETPVWASGAKGSWGGRGGAGSWPVPLRPGTPVVAGGLERLSLRAGAAATGQR